MKRSKPKSAEITVDSPSLARRNAISALGALGAAALLSACGGGDDTSTGGTAGSGGSGTGGTGASGSGGAGTGGTGTSGSGGSGAGGSGTTDCHVIPDETSGPYPDTKGMISNPAFFRSDIREDRTGLPLTLTLTILDATGCAPLANANVEVWHCDADGIYSEYSSGMNAGSTTTTYLRGVQTTDADGKVTFTTIFPGWYSPRATHIHVQVYSGTTMKKTTQIGFTDAVNAAVYATSLYKQGQNTTTNDTDQVWGNAAGMGTDGGGHDYQIASVTGDATAGYAASIAVAINGYSLRNRRSNHGGVVPHVSGLAHADMADAADAMS